MKLVNVHCHMLYGVDDGAKNTSVMMQMIDSAYRSGVREICMTPHYNPAFFRCPLEVIVSNFENAVKLAAGKYPDLRLYLGQELYYYNDTASDLLGGRALSLNRTRNVLVEFGPGDDRTAIAAGVSRLLTCGYRPLIAHVERYASLRRKRDCIRELKELGAGIQVNAASVIGKYGYFTKHYVMSLIRDGLADVVADDCHDTKDKGVCLREAYDIVLRRYGRETADVLFCLNPARLLRGDAGESRNNNRNNIK